MLPVGKNSPTTASFCLLESLLVTATSPRTCGFRDGRHGEILALKQTAFTVAKVSVVLFVAALVWGLVIGGRLGGDQICISDAETAQRFLGMGEPGVYQFDRKTGRPAHIAGSTAFAMVIEGILKPVYPRLAMCGARALIQAPDGLLGVGSLLGAIGGLLAGGVAKSRKRDPEFTAGSR